MGVPGAGVLAVIRPNEWDFPLFLHVLGSMVLVGSLLLVGTSLVGAWRGGAPAAVRVGYRALLLVALPSWILMRVSAQWIASKENVEDSDAAWIGIGYMTSEAGLLVMIVATVLAGLGLRRASRAEGPEQSIQVRIAAVLVGILLLAYLIAIWAMTTKPE